MAEQKKKLLNRVAYTGLGVIIAMQLVPYGRDHTNPSSRKEPAWDSPQTRELVVRACFDCHSNETRWPWYSNVAPVSWLLQHHVHEGREHLNFSEWDKPQKHAVEAAHEVEEGEMPLWSYLLLHGEAELPEEDKQALMRGLEATFGKEDEHGEGETEKH